MSGPLILEWFLYNLTLIKVNERPVKNNPRKFTHREAFQTLFAHHEQRFMIFISSTLNLIFAGTNFEGSPVQRFCRHVDTAPEASTGAVRTIVYPGQPETPYEPGLLAMPCVRQPCGNSVERDAKPMQMKYALSEVRAVICLGGIPKKELLWRRLENRHRGRLGTFRWDTSVSATVQSAGLVRHEDAGTVNLRGTSSGRMPHTGRRSRGPTPMTFV